MVSHKTCTYIITLIIFLIFYSYSKSSSFEDCINCPPPSFIRDRIDVSYFYLDGDIECDKTSIFLRSLSANYPFFNLVERDMKDPKAIEMRKILDELYGKGSQSVKVPAVFINKRLIIGYRAIKEGMLSILQSSLEERFSETNSIKDRIGIFFRKLKFFTVVTLGEHFFPVVLISGLIDGINPCSFVLLIFLLSFLSLTKERRSILLIGIGFLLGTFISYLGIGLGLSWIIQLEIFKVIFRWSYLILGIVSLLFGFISLLDAYYVKRGKLERVRIQLPKIFKKKTHNIIRFYSEKSNNFGLIIGVIIGSLTSFIEFACTGQIYLPIVFLIEKQARTQSLLYLLIYNLMFIVPLLIIVLLSYYVSSKRLSFMLFKNLISIKILNALVFFILGAYMISIV